MAAWRGCSCLSRTNGKAGRFIKAGQCEQADDSLHGSSAAFTLAIGLWTVSYNLAIQHGGSLRRPVMRHQEGAPWVLYALTPAIIQSVHEVTRSKIQSGADMFCAEPSASRGVPRKQSLLEVEVEKQSRGKPAKEKGPRFPAGPQVFRVPAVWTGSCVLPSLGDADAEGARFGIEGIPEQAR